MASEPQRPKKSIAQGAETNDDGALQSKAPPRRQAFQRKVRLLNQPDEAGRRPDILLQLADAGLETLGAIHRRPIVLGMRLVERLLERGQHRSGARLRRLSLREGVLPQSHIFACELAQRCDTS